MSHRVSLYFSILIAIFFSENSFNFETKSGAARYESENVRLGPCSVRLLYLTLCPAQQNSISAKYFRYY